MVHTRSIADGAAVPAQCRLLMLGFSSLRDNLHAFPAASTTSGRLPSGAEEVEAGHWNRVFGMFELGVSAELVGSLQRPLLNVVFDGRQESLNQGYTSQEKMVR